MNTIKELALQVTTKMEAAGHSPTTIWRLYVDSLLPAVRYHEAQGSKHFNPDIMAEYIRDVRQRRSGGIISGGHCARLLNGINKITRLNNTGAIECHAL